MPILFFVGVESAGRDRKKHKSSTMRNLFYIIFSTVFLLTFVSSCCSTGSPASQPSQDQLIRTEKRVEWKEKNKGKSSKKSEDYLLVAGKKGLGLMNLKGESKLILNTTPAAWPRVLKGDPQRVVFIGTEDSTLRILNLRTLAEETIAKLPTILGVECGWGVNKSYAPAEHIHRDSDILYDPKRGEMCMELGDRNENMRNVGVRVRVLLENNPSFPSDRRGRVRHSLTIEGTCKKSSMKPIPYCIPLHKTTSGDTSVTETVKYPFEWKSAEQYTADHGSVDKDGSGFSLDPDNFRLELSLERSPTGRWVAINGNPRDGDYLYRQVVLLDQKTGKFYQTGKRDDCRQAIAPNRLDKKENEYYPNPIIGEARLAWLGNKDLLLLHQSIVVPGVYCYGIGEWQPAMWGTHEAYPLCHESDKEVICR